MDYENFKKKLSSRLKRIFDQESSSGFLAIFAVCFGVIFANHSHLIGYYQMTHHTHFVVNDILMSLFFLLVTVELKHEFTMGALTNTHFTNIKFPLFAALAGMAVPITIYCAANFNHPENLKGFAIPSATDITFAICIFHVISSIMRFSLFAKIFLISLAIFDDIGAIIIITLFYNNAISLPFLIAASATATLLFITNTYHQLITIMLAVILWYCLYNSGIHPTLSGVIVGASLSNDTLKTYMNKLEPVVNFAIIPIFAFVNGGILIPNNFLDSLYNPISIGIIGGLVIGKPAGILGIYLVMRRKITEDIGVRQILIISLLAGIGFTMSLFIGNLSFTNTATLELMKLSVFLGSIISATLAIIIAIYTKLGKKNENHHG